MLRLVLFLTLCVSSMAADISTRRPVVTQRTFIRGSDSYESYGVTVLSQSGSDTSSVFEILDRSVFTPSPIAGNAANFWSSEDKIYTTPHLTHYGNLSSSGDVVYTYRDLGNRGDPQWYKVGINTGAWVDVPPIAMEPLIGRGETFGYFRRTGSPYTNSFLRGLMPMDESFTYKWSMTDAVFRVARFAPAYPVGDALFTNGISGAYGGLEPWAEDGDIINGYNFRFIPLSGLWVWGFILPYNYIDIEDGSGMAWWDFDLIGDFFVTKTGFYNYYYERKTTAVGTVTITQTRPY